MHPWGRNLAGVSGSVGTIMATGTVPYHGVLELKMSRARVCPGQLHVLAMTDWQGGELEWWVNRKVEQLALLPHETLLRITGLRVRRFGADGQLRLLPSELFTVLVEDEAQLLALKEGCVLAQVVRAHPPRVVAHATGVRLDASASLQTVTRHTEVSVELLVHGSRGPPRKAALRLVDEHVPLAALFKANDMVVIRDALIQSAGAELVYGYGPSTVVFQCPLDPTTTPCNSQAGGVVDNRLRCDPVTLSELRDYARNTTLLCRVTGIRAVPNENALHDWCVALEVFDGTVHVLVYCWRECRLAAAALRVGQDVVLVGLYSKPLRGAGTMRYDMLADATVIPVPLRGWLSSPPLWTPPHAQTSGHLTMLMGAVLVARVDAPAQHVHLACGKPSTLDSNGCCALCGMDGRWGDVQQVRATWDDGQRQWPALCALPVACAVVEAPLASAWDVCVLHGLQEDIVVECVPSHSALRCVRLLESFGG